MTTFEVEAENKAIIRRWFEEVWNRGRHELISQLRSTDATATGLSERNSKSQGPGPFLSFFTNLRSALPDFHVKIEDLLAEGDKVAVRLTGEGTHTGTGFGSAPTGRRVQLSCITIARIADGKIVEGWNSLDQLGLLTQLGFIPENQGPDRFTGSSTKARPAG